MNDVDVKAIPPRRLTALATYGLASKAGALRDLRTREHRLAVMAATVVVLSARAVDDVVETFDMLMTTKLLSKAERESTDEKLRRYPRVSRNAGKLAAAVKVMLEMVEINQDVFGATSEGEAVLRAMKTLAELLTAKPTAKTVVTLLDARKVDHDLITGGWKRMVYTPGRPEETVDRAAYTFCLLEQFHRHLKHRSIFAVRSTRWRDPQAHLLAGEAWEKARDAGMNALGLPAEPSALLTDHATALNAAYKELARLGDDIPASIDADGKLHVAALDARADPATLADLRRWVEGMIPRVDLPELVMEVMSWNPGFTEAFTHTSGNQARVADLWPSVAAVLCGRFYKSAGQHPELLRNSSDHGLLRGAGGAGYFRSEAVFTFPHGCSRRSWRRCGDADSVWSEFGGETCSECAQCGFGHVVRQGRSFWSPCADRGHIHDRATPR